MAKPSFLLGLTAVLLSLVSTSFGQETPPPEAKKITDLFTLQPGGKNGGCDDDRIKVLDQWVSESTKSVKVALDALQDWLWDDRVTDAMNVFFGIESYTDFVGADDIVEYIADNIQFVHEFLINKETGGVPWYNKKDFWIFCNSDFLTLQQRSSTARDIHGKEVLDKDKNPVTIEKIPEYLAVLDAGLNENPPKDHKLKPWWAGDHTSLNGYYFDDHGGNYCNEKGSLGVTAAINLLGDGLDNNADTAGIVICPFAFNKADSPNSYAEANKMLEVGKNLAKVVPKSATLVHEIFHAVRGDEFLSGAEERYDLAACVDLGNTRPGEAIKNIENYVFFINHMYQLFGKSSDGILKNWDFAAVDLGPKSDDKKDLLFGARVPGPEDTIPDDPMDIDKK